MIRIEDFLDELCEEFPEIERDSINKICKKGLFGIRRVLKRREELIIQGEDRKEVKFFFPMAPEYQAELTAWNVTKRRYYEK